MVLGLLALLAGVAIASNINLPDIDGYFQRRRKDHMERHGLRNVSLYDGIKSSVGKVLKDQRGGLGYAGAPRGREGRGSLSGTSISYEGPTSQLYYQVAKRRSEWNPFKRWRYGREARRYAEKRLGESVEVEKENWGLTIEKREEQARLRNVRSNLENLIAEIRRDELNYETAYRGLKEQEELFSELLDDLGLMGIEILQQLETNSPSPMNVRASHEKLNVKLTFEHLVPERTETYLFGLRGIIQSYIRGDKIPAAELDRLVKRVKREKVYYSKCVEEVYANLAGEDGIRDIIADSQEKIADIDREIAGINSSIREIKDNEYEKRKESEEFERLRLEKELALWIQDSRERERMRGYEVRHVDLVRGLDKLGGISYESAWKNVPEEKKEKTRPKEKESKPKEKPVGKPQ